MQAKRSATHQAALRIQQGAKLDVHAARLGGRHVRRRDGDGDAQHAAELDALALHVLQGAPACAVSVWQLCRLVPREAKIANTSSHAESVAVHHEQFSVPLKMAGIEP